MKKLSKTEAELRKSVAYRKNVYLYNLKNVKAGRKLLKVTL